MVLTITQLGVFVALIAHPVHGFNIIHQNTLTQYSPFNAHARADGKTDLKHTLLSAASLSQDVGSILPAGITKTVTKTGRGSPINLGDVATVRYSCYVAGDDTTSSAPFARSLGQQFVVGDGLMVDGWELALQTMVKGERSTIYITDPRFAYGSAGVSPIVPENAEIEMDLEILDVEAGVDLGTIASADPLKPRTPASIAAAYNTRREITAMEEADKKEGLEGMIAKFKTFYFFGFFEGETGQKAPWYLRPSITFPIAFAIVGAAFWVAYAGGGITERGIQVKDDLDEFIVSMGGNTGGPVGQLIALAFLANLGNGF